MYYRTYLGHATNQTFRAHVEEKWKIPTPFNTMMFQNISYIHNNKSNMISHFFIRSQIIVSLL